jgi:hypothetical protein
LLTLEGPQKSAPGTEAQDTVLTLQDRISRGTALFSTDSFVRAWVAEFEKDARVVSLSLGIGSEQSTMHGVGRPAGSGFFAAEFGPYGICACPSPYPLHCRYLRRDLLQQLKKNRLCDLMWHVRFDNESLTSLLHNAGFNSEPYWTHALTLDKPHQEIFAAYSTTRRNQIRKCYRRGVAIRQAQNQADVLGYCQMHEKLEVEKGFRLRYPRGLINELFQIKEHTILLLAEVENRVIGGALCFRDGDALIYWHGAADSDYAEYFPMGALLDQAVKISLHKQLKHFDFGASPSDSLRHFKESFGAQSRQNRSFRIRPELSVAQRLTRKTKVMLRPFRIRLVLP